MPTEYNTMLTINCDLGEGYENDAQIMPLIDEANIACGGHAGNAESMRLTIELAQRHGVAVGAHPSYPDRDGFGRRSMELPAAALRDSVLQQVTMLLDQAASLGAQVTFIKPHGALYHDVLRKPVVRKTTLSVAQALGLPLVIQAGEQFAAIAQECGDLGIPCRREAFADRRYTPDGGLQSRACAGSLLSVEAAAEQARQLVVDGHVITTDGSRLPMRADTLCIHGDHPDAIRIAELVSQELRVSGRHDDR